MKKIYSKIIIIIFFLAITIGGGLFLKEAKQKPVAAGGVFLPIQGGSGTNLIPNLGDILVGQSTGLYAPQATSTLGIAGGTGSPGGSDGQVQYNNGGAFGGGTDFIWDDTNNRLGIGTSSPYAKLSVVGEIVGEYFTATSTTATSTFNGLLDFANMPFVNGTDIQDTFVDVAGDTMTGALTVADLATAITSGDYAIQLQSGIADGASAIGYIYDTANDLATAGSEMAVWRNNGTDVVHIEKKGLVTHDKIAIGADAVLGGSTGQAILALNDSVNSGIGIETAALEFTAVQAGSALAARPVGLLARAQTDSLGGFGVPITILAELVQNSNTNWNSVGGQAVFLGRIISTTGTTGNLGNVAVYLSEPNYSGAKPTTVKSFHAQNMGSAGITNAIGMQVDKQTGATNNYGIVLNGDGVGSDLVLGAGQDAKIYYDGTDLLFDTKAVGTGGALFTNNVSVGTSTPYAKLTVWGDGTGTGTLFEAVDNASTTRMKLLDNGNFGIGTTSPFAKLSVAGAGYFDTNITATNITATGTINIIDGNVQTITAATDQITTPASHIEINPDADYVLTSTPNIATSTASSGQLLFIHNIDSVFEVDLQDNSILTNSGIELSGAEATIQPDGVMTLMYDIDKNRWHVISNPNTATAGASASLLEVRNQTGSSIPAGSPVYITGWNSGQNRPLIDLADANDPAKNPSIGVTHTAIPTGSNSTIVESGNLVGAVDTSSAAVGDGVWLSTTAGAVVFTRPAVDDIQRLGTVARSHATQGVIVITGAGRVNDTPIDIVVSNATTTNLYVSGQTRLASLTGFLKATAGVVATALIDLANDVTGLLPSANIVDEYLFNTGDIGTGVYDFGGATSFEIPNGAAPVFSAIGQIGFDSTDGMLIIDDGTNDLVIRTEEKIFSFTLASTSPEFYNGGELATPLEKDGYTVTNIKCYVQGGTSVVATFTDNTNAMDSLTCTTTATTDDGTIANASVTANELMYVDIGAVSGTPDYLTFSVFGRWTKE